MLEQAHAAERVLVTLDKDFRGLAVVYWRSHSEIVRLVNRRARRQPQACLRVLDRYSEDLRGGALVTAEPGGVRIRGEPSPLLTKLIPPLNQRRYDGG